MAAVKSLVVALLLTLASAPAFAGASSGFAADIARALPGAPARAVAGDLKAAQGQVDAALALRKKRFDSWQKAAAARDKAAADVAHRKRAGASKEELEASLRKALQLDEQAAKARSQVLAAEADVAKGGAELLRLYDALLAERRAVAESLRQNDPSRPAAVSAYKDLVAQRDAVRRALLPVLHEDTAVAGPAVDLQAKPNDDVEALLAKADLARDLEDRAMRQASSLRRRIAELEEEQGVAHSVSDMLNRGALFDEEDRHLPIVSRNLQSAKASNLNGDTHVKPTDGAPQADGRGPTLGDTTTDAEAAPAPPACAACAVSSPEPAAPLTSAEQAFAGPQTDSSIASLVSSSSVSLDQLRALEKKLRVDAKRFHEQSTHLRDEASTRQ
jgi:hypothetical protein